MNELKTELQRLYGDASKHSTYQSIPNFVAAEFDYNEAIDENWRGDQPRLAYLLSERAPAAGETWMDFGANTGFFALTLAHGFPRSSFIAVEANPNHARFIKRIIEYFEMTNVEIVQQAVGLRDLPSLPRTDFMLHLNVLHHAGHDFDPDLVPAKANFANYAIRYLHLLHERTGGMLFQMGSNWGGNKNQPLIGTREDAEKLRKFTSWLRAAGWIPRAVAYPHKQGEGSIAYENLHKSPPQLHAEPGDATERVIDREALDELPGEFHRRPIFHCSNSIDGSENSLSISVDR